jgi:hypothetical protein
VVKSPGISLEKRGMVEMRNKIMHYLRHLKKWNDACYHGEEIRKDTGVVMD